MGLVYSSGQWKREVVEGRGYLSCSFLIRCWSDVCASRFVSAKAYVLMWYLALNKASKHVAVHP
jgi:hypothetical protein